MTEQRKRRVKLKLCDHNNRLACARETANGMATDDEQLEIRENSFLPRAAFFLVQHALVNRMKRIPRSEKSFGAMVPQIRKGLAAGARDCGCDYDWKAEHDRMLWKPDPEDKRPVLGFIILDFSKHHDKKEYRGKGLLKLAEKVRTRREEFRRMERRCHAVLRFAIIVIQGTNGGLIPKVIPAKTLPKEKR